MQSEEDQRHGGRERRGWLLPLFATAVCVAVVFQIGVNRDREADVAALRSELADARREAQAARTAAAAVPAVEPRRLLSQPANDAELTRLRGEVNKLRGQIEQVAIAQAAATPTEEIPVELIESNEWKNAGWETPAASIETFFWAALGNQDKTVSDFILIPDEQRPAIEAWFAGLDAPTRQRYATPEKLFGLMMAQDAGPLTGLQLLQERAISDSDVMVKVRFGTDDGIGQADYLLRHTPAGWRLVVPPDAIEWVGQQLNGDAR